MRTTMRITLAAVVLLALLTLLAPSRRQSSDATSEVWVTNFPEVQEVKGRVGVEGTLRPAELVAFREIIVPPVAPTDTTRLVEAGTLAMDGYPQVVLSLHGVVKGSVHKAGAVGAILLPREPTIEDAFHEIGLLHFPLQVTAGGVAPTTSYFASDQPLYEAGFPSYRVLLYNTTDKTVTANVFAYLRN